MPESIDARPKIPVSMPESPMPILKFTKAGPGTSAHDWVLDAPDSSLSLQRLSSNPSRSSLGA